MSATIPEFQRYQLAFTAHLRDPKQHAAPAGVPAKRMAVYEEIVFNNLLQSVSACFPVASAVLGKRKWRKLVQNFMRDYSANSPLFREIPKQFVDFLHSNQDIQNGLPPYIYALCHYEWVELYVSALPLEIQPVSAETILDLNSMLAVFNPTLQLLSYDYAVHRISPRKKPSQPAPTQLLVYRNTEHQVKFVEINAVTYQLITLMQSQRLTGAQALKILAQQLGYPDVETIMQYGLSILHDLKTQEIIIGVVPKKYD